MSGKIEMPFPPEAVPLMDNNFLTGLGRFERELAAGRIVKTSCAEGGWVGLSRLRLRTDAYNDHARANELIQKRSRHMAVQRAYRRELKKAMRLSVLTLGVYALVRKMKGTWPQPPAALEEERTDFGDTNSYEFAVGLEELIQYGFLVTEQNPNDPEDIIVFPTPRLVAGIYPIH